MVLKITFDDFKVFNKVIYGSIQLLGHANFKFTPDGIKLGCLSENRLSLVGLIYPKDGKGIKTYTCTQEYDFCPDVYELNDTLIRLKGCDSVFIELLEEKNIVKFTFEEEESEKKILMKDNPYESDSYVFYEKFFEPTLKGLISINLPIGFLKEFIDKTQSEIDEAEVIFTLNKRFFSLCLDNFEVELENNEKSGFTFVETLKEDEIILSKYEYKDLEKIVQLDTDCSKTILSFDSKKPLRLRYLIESTIQVIFMIVPIEEF